MSNGQTPARQDENAPPARTVKPKRELTKAEVKEQIRRRSASMDGHLDGLQQEMMAAGQEAQQVAERTLQQQTLAVVGGVGLAGAALGYWMVRRRRKKRAAAAARTWADEYRDAVRREVRAASDRGEDPGETAGRILEGHQPIVVRERSGGGSTGGLLQTVLQLAGRTLVSLAVKYAVDAVSEQYLSPDETEDLDEAGESAAVTSAATDA